NVHKTIFHGVSPAPNFGQSDIFDDIITIGNKSPLDEVKVSEEYYAREPSISKYINVTPHVSNDSLSIQPSTPSPIGKIRPGPSKSITPIPTHLDSFWTHNQITTYRKFISYTDK
ncbi:hypothetical protein HK096_005259, partial [Nowakowskiella sp. JEL0078]